MFLCYNLHNVKLEIGFGLDTQEGLHISIIVTVHGCEGSRFTENVNRPTTKANEKEITLNPAFSGESVNTCHDCLNTPSRLSENGYFPSRYQRDVRLKL